MDTKVKECCANELSERDCVRRTSRSGRREATDEPAGEDARPARPPGVLRLA